MNSSFKTIDDFFKYISIDVDKWNQYGRSASGTGDDYKKSLIERTQFFYKINDCRNVNTNFSTQRQYPFWAVSEILSEILAMNPPLMSRYKPEIIEWAYKLRPDKSIEYMYGRRWNEWNQLLNTAEILSKRQDSKRAVIPIFMPYDTDPTRNDVPCVPGYVEVLSPEGDIPIKILHDKIQQGQAYHVFSVNKNKEVEIKKITNSWYKGKKDIYRVYFDDNNYCDFTDNHEIFIKKRNKQNKIEYIKIQVKDLKKGDRIIPLTKLVNEHAKRKIIGKIKGNHKVVKVKKLKSNVDVYDIEVEDNHNFFAKFVNYNKLKINTKINKNLANKVDTTKNIIQMGMLVSNCTVNYMFKIREDKLNMSVFFRSHDLFSGVKYDFILSSFINQLMTMMINAKSEKKITPGNLGIYEDSLHIYDLKDSEKLTKFKEEAQDIETNKQQFDLMYNYKTIDQIFDDIIRVSKAEESSYYGNFDFAKYKIENTINPAFRDFGRVYYNRNAEFNNKDVKNKHKKKVELLPYETKILKW